MIMEYVHYCNILVLISGVHDQRIFCTWRHHKNDRCQPKFIKKGHVNKIFNAHEIKTDVKCTDIHDRQSWRFEN